MYDNANSNSELNIVVSSWPSAGGTTTALLLANIFSLEYIYAGGVLKYWAKKMGFDPTSSEFHQWELKFGKAWDHFWESYIAKKLEISSGFLCEGKTTGFLLPVGRAFEIMVTAETETRQERANKDTRTESIQARDHLLQRRWLDLFQIDLFSKPKISENYDLHIDNTKLSLEETLREIVESVCLQQNKFGLDQSHIQSRLEQFIVHYESSEANQAGKQYLRSTLSKNNLYISPKDVFEDWKKNFVSDLSKLPDEMSTAVIA